MQTGGPSGGCIPASLFDTPVDYDSLAQVGSIMGSGGMVVMDESTNMVDVASYYMEFCKDESCGKCIPCRVGTEQMHRLLGKIRAGQATQADLDRLTQLCRMVRETSLCGSGQSAPNPVLSTLRYFPKNMRHLSIRSRPVTLSPYTMVIPKHQRHAVHHGRQTAASSGGWRRGSYPGCRLPTTSCLLKSYGR